VSCGAIIFAIMKILVTGGAGFMGSNFIRYILKKYPAYQVVNFDKLTYAGNLENLRDVESDPRYEFIRGDIGDDQAVEAVIGQGIDAIINYAAETHVDRSLLEPRAFAVTDVVGTLTLLQAVQKFNVPRMIQISTDEVYGSTEEGYFTEDSPLRPSSPYSASKAGGDLLCGAYSKSFGAPVIVTHSANVYGPYQYPEKLMPLAITNLLEGKKVPVYGDGLHEREWIHVQDHCRAIDAVLHHGKPGETYNIGTGNYMKNIDAVRLILNHLDKDDNHLEFVADRRGHDRRYALSAEKIKNELNWRPEVSFADGLREKIEWYKNNKEWWQRIKSGEFRKYYEKQYLHPKIKIPNSEL
jgi:dTDP-glucose 4,6-dehydratase